MKKLVDMYQTTCCSLAIIVANKDQLKLYRKHICSTCIVMKLLEIHIMQEGIGVAARVITKHCTEI